MYSTVLIPFYRMQILIQIWIPFFFVGFIKLPINLLYSTSQTSFIATIPTPLRDILSHQPCLIYRPSRVDLLICFSLDSNLTIICPDRLISLFLLSRYFFSLSFAFRTFLFIIILLPTPHLPFTIIDSTHWLTFLLVSITSQTVYLVMTKAKKSKARQVDQRSPSQYSPNVQVLTSSPNQISPPADKPSKSFNPPLPPSEPPMPPSKRPSEPPQPPAEPTNASWLKVQTLDDDLKDIFWNHNVAKTSRGVTCLNMYRILCHFNAETKHRPYHLKDKLWNGFLKEVSPVIQPYLVSPPPTPMQTEANLEDFDPLSRNTTRKDLADSVRQVNPRLYIPTTSPRNWLLVLYKTFIDHDLHLPWLTKYVTSPRVVHQSRIKSLSMEDLRMTLQERAPHVFIHMAALNLSVL